MPTVDSQTKTIISALQKVRKHKPLVLNITNYVVMNNSANALLAIGASPIMAHSRKEMDELITLSGALVINIGTLDIPWIERMTYAIELANSHNKIVILDPVGCGASQLRTETSRRFAELADWLIIKGNASEIIAMAGKASQSKGVDALDTSKAAITAAEKLVKSYQCNVVITGETDYIVSKAARANSTNIMALNNGDAMMPLVTGMGCSLTALTGAFAAVGETTGLAATAVMGVAGEIAAECAKGPGSFQVALLDTLYQLDEEALKQRLKLAAIL